MMKMTKEQAKCVIGRRDRLILTSEKRALQIAAELAKWIDEGDATIQREGLMWYVRATVGAVLRETERDATAAETSIDLPADISATLPAPAEQISSQIPALQ
jgi:hypothetical protein